MNKNTLAFCLKSAEAKSDLANIKINLEIQKKIKIFDKSAIFNIFFSCQSFI